MRRLVGRGKNGGTKYDGEEQGKYDKVEEEDDLKDQCGDGENFPKGGIADVKSKVHCKGDDDRPR